MTPAIMAEEKPKRRRPEVFADPCPRCGSPNTRVRSKRNRNATTRYCYCQDCPGPGWKQSPKKAG